MVVPTASPQTLWTRGFFAVIGTQVAANYAASTFLLLPKYLATEFHASPNDIGHVNAIPGLVAVLIVPFVGGFLDRVGRRPLMAAGAALACAHSLAWIGIDRLSPAVYALQILAGLSWMFSFSGSSTLVTDHAPPEKLSQAIGVFGAANISMNAFAPAIAEPTAEHFGWRAAFALAAAAAALSLLLSRLVTEPARQHVAGAGDEADLAATLSVARRLLPYVFAMVTCGAAFGAVFTFYQPFVIAQGAKQVSTFFVGFMLAAVSTRLGLGSLADRVGRRRVALRAFAVYVLVVLAMTQLAPNRLLWLGLAFGAAHGFFYPALTGLALEVTATRERGRAMTIITGAFNLGNTSSVMTFGWVAHVYGYQQVFVLAALVTCLGVAVLYVDGLRRTSSAASTP